MRKAGLTGGVVTVRLEPDLRAAVQRHAEAIAAEGMPPNVCAALRDLVRRGLGMHGEERGRREGYFAALREARVAITNAISRRGGASD